MLTNSTTTTIWQHLYQTGINYLKPLEIIAQSGRWRSDHTSKTTNSIPEGGEEEVLLGGGGGWKVLLLLHLNHFKRGPKQSTEA